MSAQVLRSQQSTHFPVLATKLLAPPPRSDTIARPELSRRLSAGLNGRLTVLSAPPGFGKTTSVVNWYRAIADDGWRLGWVALDAGDNDVARFLTYLIHGFKALGADVGNDALSLLENVQRVDWHVSLTVLLNELERNAEPVLLVLDDYHEITEPEIHDALAFLVEHLPPTAHIVITARKDPPLSLSLLRARRELTEIGVDQLRFTLEESRSFITDVMRIHLRPGQIEELERRTEGWIAGLLLAALSIVEGDDADEFIATFGGDHHFVFDYLAEEVLNRQPPDLQQFLLQTSVLDQLSADLCNAVTGFEDGAETLVRLDDANLFLVRLDRSRNWYRYHHLFREFLSSRFQRDDPDGWRLAHQQAANKYENERLFHQAIDHVLAVKNYEHAARLITETGMRTVKAGRMATLHRWFDHMPEPLVLKQRELVVVKTWTLLMAREFAEVAQYLDLLENAENGSERDTGQADVTAAICVSLSLLTGDIQRAVDLGTLALPSLSPDDVFSRSMVLVHLGTAYRMQGNLKPAVELLTEGMELCDTVGNIPAWLVAASQRAIAWMTMGDLRLAHDAFREVLEVESKLGLVQLGFAIASHLGLAEILREWDKLDEAEEVLMRALNVLEQLEDREQFGTKLYAYITLIRLWNCRGDHDRAFEIANQAMEEADAASVSDWEYERADAFRVRTALALGRAEDAVRLVKRWQPPTRPLSPEREIAYQVFARLSLVSGNVNDGLALIQDAKAMAHQAGLRRRLIELAVIESLALLNQGDCDSAAASLSKAFDLAEPDGYCRVFVDDGAALIPALDYLGEHRPNGAAWSTDYLQRIRSLSGDLLQSGSGVAASMQAALVDPLTDRETEVLELLAQGLSNQLVADRLFLSVGTIKRHTHNIYGKLDVHSRTQAVIRGQELGLLEDAS